MKRVIYIILVALIVNGCHIYKAYERPEGITIEESFRLPDSTRQSAGDTISMADISWQDVFTDKKLQDLINYGIEHNTDLLVAIQRVNAAKAALSASKLSFLPSLSLAPQGNVSSFNKSAASWTYNASVNASWEIDLFGKLMNAKRQAKVAMLQNVEYKQAVRTQLIANIAEYYFTLITLDKQLEIYKETEKSWKESVETIKLLKEGGMTNEAAVSQSEANYYMVSASIHDIKSEILRQENALCSLLGNSPHNIERGSIDDQTINVPITTGLPIQLLSNRPDVKNAECNLAAMYYNTNQARAAFYPQITIGGSAGWANYVGETIINPGKLILSALASITQPLFYRGTNIAKLKIAKAQEEEAKLNFQQTLINAGQEVSDALIIYEAEEKKSALIAMQINALKNSVNYTSELMKLGSSTYLEVLTSQQSLLSALLNDTEDKLSKLNAVVSLYHALGGGRETDKQNDSSQNKTK